MFTKREFKVDFIGIGVMKAATSWIFECLKEHPEICMCSEKEPHFFDWPFRYKKGLDYYFSMYKHCPQDKIKGEFTASYIRFPHALSLIHKHFPSVKLIISLRNPIDRAFSQYQYSIQLGGRLSVYKNFREALENDKANLVERGFYYKQLKSCYQIFPREHVLILFFDDIKKDPLKYMQQIYSFLGLKNQEFIPNLINKIVLKTGSKSAQSKIPFLSKIIFKIGSWLNKFPKLKIFIINSDIMEYIRKLVKFDRKIIFKNEIEDVAKTSIDLATRKYLYDIYKKDIEKLENLLNKSLSSWKEDIE
ncbi:MAG: sulfotransferase domain-containing protein [Promethearchaeota archaeon]